MLNIFADTLKTAVLADRGAYESGVKSRGFAWSARRSGPIVRKLPNEMRATSFTCAGKSYKIATSAPRHALPRHRPRFFSF
ncbi:hypothetical protein [Oricola cellulosilytica]|uniref:Uncharacterized protein n=1 Tax=Oricola cellulosilytica TaxID=1429082 RepID=A0A4R0PAG1_9HYPH|nr:hypothetical protein [Oricola cellulosilytica]TCD11825.1 hypothetical protein E0D97_15925 [Oricola cellulosilytica]